MAFCGHEFISKFPLRMSFRGKVQISLKCWLFLYPLQSFAHEKIHEAGASVKSIDGLEMVILACTVNWFSVQLSCFTLSPLSPLTTVLPPGILLWHRCRDMLLNPIECCFGFQWWMETMKIARGRARLPTWVYMPQQGLLWVAHSVLINDIHNPTYTETHTRTLRLMWKRLLGTQALT